MKKILILVLLSSFQLNAQCNLPAPDQWYMATNDNGFGLFVYEFGKGETVIVLHGGWGAEHSYLLDMVSGLENQFRFVFYDQRGSLRSPGPDSMISVTKHVQDLETLRLNLGLQKINLLAHSMGGYLAMKYLETYPENVKNLVLAGPVKPKSDIHNLTFGAESWFSRKEITEQLKKERLDKPQEMLNDRERTHAWRVEFAGINIYDISKWREVKGGWVFYNARAGTVAAASMQPWDFTKVLAAHPFPVTVIIGDHDYVDFGVIEWKKAADLAPNIRLHVLEKAGHNAWIDHPELFKDLLKAALKIN